MTYSRDFREKVLFIKEKENLSFAKTAKRFGVGKESIVRWAKNIARLSGCHLIQLVHFSWQFRLHKPLDKLSRS